MEILKEFTIMFTFKIVGLKRVQNLIFTIVASYNLIRLFNLIKKNNMDLCSAIITIRFISLT